MDKKKAIKLMQKRTEIVTRLSERLEVQVKENEAILLREVLDKFVDNLDTKDGKIANTLRNKRLIASLDKIFQTFGREHGVAIASGIVSGVQEIFQFNKSYYSAFEDSAKLVPINAEVQTTLNTWLGVGDGGKLVENGYLSTLIQDATVKNQIRDFMVRAVVGGSGLMETRQALKQTIVGDKQNAGALQKYYRNFVYDTFSQVDRTAAKITADKLKLRFAIYEGGLIETSRKFCKDKNGKVFSREEIADFDPKEAKPPNYNPFTDLGGYGCRHHLNWIPDALAFILRPELKLKYAA